MGQANFNTLSTSDSQALTSLSRALSLSEGKFSLILIRSHSGRLEQQAVDVLHQGKSNKARTLTLPESATNFYTFIQGQLEDDKTSPLIVTGWSTVERLDELLVSANRMRNEFRRHFNFPIVLWMDDGAVQRLIRMAPDFYNWASAPIRID